MSGRTVLLISANSETYPAPVYPLALARLAGAVERAGHEARQFDPLVHGTDALAAVVEECRPDLVAVSLRNIDNIDATDCQSYVDQHASIVQAVRACTSAPVVAGGSAFSLFPEELMRRLALDFGIVGPGEAALPALLDALDNKAALSQVPNLITAGEDHVQTRDTSPPIAESKHDPDLVRYYWDKGGMIGIQSKRGCPKRCVYCTYPLVDGRRVVWADPVALVDEMERLLRDHGVSFFFITDSIFNLDADRETALAEEICRRSLAIHWGAFFAPRGMTRDYVRTLKAAGLTHVEFGTEAMSDEVLPAYGKDFDVAETLRTSSLCTEMGLYCAHYLLFGGPGETLDTVRESVANAGRLERCAFFPFTGMRIYPGTPLHAMALDEGVIGPEDDCLAPVFYFAQGVQTSDIWRIVETEADAARHWLAPVSYADTVPLLKGLRERGEKGLLWEYLISRKRLPRKRRRPPLGAGQRGKGA